MESTVTALVGRIQTEFAKSKAKLEALRRQKVDEFKGRQDRLALFEKACESLKGVWGPRLEGLKQAFGQNVKVTPMVAGGRRQADFSFTSELARINLTFTAATDLDVRNLVLEYSLTILPILMSYPNQARLEQPFDQVDPAITGAWIDDRIVDFVTAYLALHENEFYLKAHMVEDPVAHVRFPKFAAGSTLERGGRTLYFIGNETREQFEAREKAG